MKTQLLCTFSSKTDIEKNLEFIKNNYKLVYNYIYVLQNKNIPNDLFITYNIEVGGDYRQNELKTILVHRKKQSNTLYTINALNQVVMEKTGGMMDTNYEINWDEYKNCILLTNADGVRKITTRVFDVIEIN